MRRGVICSLNGGDSVVERTGQCLPAVVGPFLSLEFDEPPHRSTRAHFCFLIREPGTAMNGNGYRLLRHVQPRDKLAIWKI
jgi:hypothetical protein